MQFRCTYKYTEPPLYIPDTRTLYTYIFEDTNHGVTTLSNIKSTPHLLVEGGLLVPQLLHGWSLLLAAPAEAQEVPVVALV